MVEAEIISRAQPHLLPGYTGYCPQYRFRFGETYGGLTHKLLLDPTINHAETLILSNISTEDYEVIRPPKSDIDIVDTRKNRTDPIFHHPMTPGYEGFTPNLNVRNGQRYSVLATEGFAEFERQHLHNKAASNNFKKVVSSQNGQSKPRNLENRLLLESHFKIPMFLVRPELTSLMRNLQLDEQCDAPKDHSPSPYFMDNVNPNKNFVSGYTGHIPNGFAHFGASSVPLSNSALREFTTNYMIRQSTEWAPATISRPDPPILIQSTVVYQKDIGLIPNYGGHVPGTFLRFGKTYGADSKDAKRWLRGDFSM